MNHIRNDAVGGDVGCKIGERERSRQMMIEFELIWASTGNEWVWMVEKDLKRGMAK